MTGAMTGLIETLRRREFVAKLRQQRKPARVWGGGIQFFIMSQHRSLRAASTTGAKRNVMKRFERVAVLKKRGQWKTGDRVTGLRKTKGEP
jgi:small basic protein (TIGR04137 family)